MHSGDIPKADRLPASRTFLDGRDVQQKGHEPQPRRFRHKHSNLFPSSSSEEVDASISSRPSSVSSDSEYSDNRLSSWEQLMGARVRQRDMVPPPTPTVPTAAYRGVEFVIPSSPALRSPPPFQVPLQPQYYPHETQQQEYQAYNPQQQQTYQQYYTQQERQEPYQQYHTQQQQQPYQQYHTQPLQQYQSLEPAYQSLPRDFNQASYQRQSVQPRPKPLRIHVPDDSPTLGTAAQFGAQPQPRHPPNGGKSKEVVVSPSPQAPMHVTGLLEQVLGIMNTIVGHQNDLENESAALRELVELVVVMQEEAETLVELSDLVEEYVDEVDSSCSMQAKHSSPSRHSPDAAVDVTDLDDIVSWAERMEMDGLDDSGSFGSHDKADSGVDVDTNGTDALIFEGSLRGMSPAQRYPRPLNPAWKDGGFQETYLRPTPHLKDTGLMAHRQKEFRDSAVELRSPGVRRDYRNARWDTYR